MSEQRTAVAFSATEAFHKQADESSRRLGMTRAKFIAAVIEFALDDQSFFMSAFAARAMREATVAWKGGESLTVGPRSKSVQLMLPKKELKRLDVYAKRMNKSRSEVMATLAEEGLESQLVSIRLAEKPWFQKFVKFMERNGAFGDVMMAKVIG